MTKAWNRLVFLVGICFFAWGFGASIYYWSFGSFLGGAALGILVIGGNAILFSGE